MQQLLGLTGPIFGLIAIGWAAVRFGAFDRAHLPALARFVIAFCLPALLWKVLSQRHPAEVADPRFLAAYAIGSLAALAVGLAWARSQRQPRDRAAMTGMGFSCANTAFIGHPLALQVVGPEASIAFALVLLVENFLMLPLCLALADSARPGPDGRPQPFGRAFGQAVWDLRKNPIVLGVCAGLLTGAIGLGLPGTLGRVVDLLGAGSAAASLFFIGGSLAGLRLGGQVGQVGAVAVGKLLVHPLAVAGALWLCGPVAPALQWSGVVMAAAPMLGIYPVLGQRYGLQQVNAAALLGATVAAFVTLTAWLGGLHGLGPALR